MKALLFLGQHHTAEDMRRLFTAARRAGATYIKVLLFGSSLAGETALPCQEICLFPKAEFPLLPEDALEPLCQAAGELHPDFVFTPSGDFCNHLLICLGTRLGAIPTLDVVAVGAAPAGLLVNKRIYAYNILANWHISHTPTLLSLCVDQFPPDETGGSPRNTQGLLAPGAGWCQERAAQKRALACDIQCKELVLVGGAGLGSRENAQKLAALGAHLQAGVCATRPAVYAGWFARESLVGVSGLRLQAKRCIVFGASGTKPLLLGIEKCRYIMAINHQPQAAIFGHCDEAVLADCGEVLDALLLHYKV